MSRYFASPTFTSVAEDGSRQTLYTRANTYVWELLNVSGTLYLFTTDSPSTEHAAGTVAAVRTSTDDGVTWSGATTLYSGGGTGRHGNAGGACLLSSGRILVSLQDQSDSDPYDVVPIVIYSDNGSTWSSPYSVTNTFSGDCVTGDFAQMANGHILLSLYGEQTGIVGGNTFVKTVLSTDNGATFGSENTAASSASRTYQEPQFALVGANVVMLMRSDTNVHTWRTTSVDGVTWTSPADVVALAGPPDFIQASAGTLFCMARNDNTVWRPRWAMSFDSGVTWGSIAEVDTGETKELDGTGIAFVDQSHFLTIYALANSGSSSTVYLRKWALS